MTDDEEFTAILSAFPIDSEALEALRDRAEMLCSKARKWGRRPGDGTMTLKSTRQLIALVNALGELTHAVGMIERDEDPDDDIPF